MAKQKYKIKRWGGGFAAEQATRASLESARAYALAGFELRYHTRHKLAAIYQSDGEGGWTLIEKLEYKP